VSLTSLATKATMKKNNKMGGEGGEGGMAGEGTKRRPASLGRGKTMTIREKGDPKNDFSSSSPTSPAYSSSTLSTMPSSLAGIEGGREGGWRGVAIVHMDSLSGEAAPSRRKEGGGEGGIEEGEEEGEEVMEEVALHDVDLEAQAETACQ